MFANSSWWKNVKSFCTAKPFISAKINSFFFMFKFLCHVFKTSSFIFRSWENPVILWWKRWLKQKLTGLLSNENHLVNQGLLKRQLSWIMQQKIMRYNSFSAFVILLKIIHSLRFACHFNLSQRKLVACKNILFCYTFIGWNELHGFDFNPGNGD